MLKDSNPLNVHIRGKVFDETMKTIVIRSTRTWRIAKKNAVFKFNLNGKPVRVEGNALIGRPENRVKKRTKKRW